MSGFIEGKDRHQAKLFPESGAVAQVFHDPRIVGYADLGPVEFPVEDSFDTNADGLCYVPLELASIQTNRSNVITQRPEHCRITPIHA